MFKYLLLLLMLIFPTDILAADNDYVKKFTAGYYTVYEYLLCDSKVAAESTEYCGDVDDDQSGTPNATGDNEFEFATDALIGAGPNTAGVPAFVSISIENRTGCSDVPVIQIMGRFYSNGQDHLITTIDATTTDNTFFTPPHPIVTGVLGDATSMTGCTDLDVHLFLYFPRF